MDMFKCDDVATLLTKRKQKFAGSFAQGRDLSKIFDYFPVFIMQITWLLSQWCV